MADEPRTATGRRAALKISAARCLEASDGARSRRPVGIAGTSSVADASATSRQVQVNGPQRLAEGDRESLGQNRGHPALAEAQGRLRDRLEERVMVDGHLDAPPELGGGQIARDREERRTVEVGIAHTGRQVRGAGSKCRDAEPWRARHSPHDVGRERR